MYENLMNYSTHEMQYPKLTYQTFSDLILDNDCPWKFANIGKGVVVNRMVFPAAPVRHVFLPAPAMILTFTTSA
jgi:hypothetical protein